MSGNSNGGCGMTFTVLFTQTLFLILSSTGAVNWNAWIVWSPLLLGLGVVLAVFIIAVLIGALAELT